MNNAYHESIEKFNFYTDICFYEKKKQQQNMKFM